MIDWEAPTGGYLLQAPSRRAPRRAWVLHDGCRFFEFPLPLRVRRLG